MKKPLIFQIPSPFFSAKAICSLFVAVIRQMMYFVPFRNRIKSEKNSYLSYLDGLRLYLAITTSVEHLFFEQSESSRAGGVSVLSRSGKMVVR